MARMVPNAKPLLDDLSHQTRTPQLCVVSHGLRAALENACELLQVLRIQQWFATGTAGFLQARASGVGQDLGPPIYRLAVDTELPSNLRLAQTSLQQPSGFEAPLLETIEITSYACWISHATNAKKERTKRQLYYVILNSMNVRQNMTRSVDCAPPNNPMQLAGCAGS